MSSLTKLKDDSFRGLLWNFLSVGGNSIARVISLAILARLLTPEDFGLVGAALIAFGFSNLFSQLGVGPALVQRSEVTELHVRTGFTISVLMSGVFTVAVFLLSPWIAQFFQMPKLTSILHAVALLFLGQGMGIVSKSMLQRDLRFKALAVVNFLSYVVGYGVVGIVLAWLGFGVWSLVIGQIAKSVLRTVSFFLLCRHSLVPALDRPAASDLLFYGGGYTLVRLANYLANQGDNIVVGRTLGADILGLYGRAYQFLLMPTLLLGQAVDRVLFPTMAKVQDDQRLLSRAYETSTGIVALVVLPVSVFIVIFAPEIVHILLGEQWTQIILPVQILTVSLLARIGFKMSATLARSTGAVYQCAWRQAVYAVAIIGGAIIGQVWGLTGVAVGVVTAVFINYVLMSHLGLKITRLPAGRFLGSQRAGIALALLLVPILVVVASACRLFIGIPIANMIVACVLAPLVVVLAWRVAPSTFLGHDGRWLIRFLWPKIPACARHSLLYVFPEADKY